jgi:hypothetical protein
VTFLGVHIFSKSSAQKVEASKKYDCSPNWMLQQKQFDGQSCDHHHTCQCHEHWNYVSHTENSGIWNLGDKSGMQFLNWGSASRLKQSG